MVSTGRIFFVVIFLLLYVAAPMYAQQEQVIVVSQIVLEGNKKTKPSIIFRELTFSQSDTLTLQQLEDKINQSKDNLINTSLFHYATFEIKQTDNLVAVTVHLVERWYLWPFPILKMSDRNFNTWWQTKDVSHFNYGMYVTQENFRGRKEFLKLLLTVGYDQHYAISYTKPYINKKQTIGLGFDAGFVGNHELVYTTINNRQKFYEDKEKFLQQRTYALAELTIRQRIYTLHTLQLQYNAHRFADTVLLLNPLFSYNQKNKLRYLSLYYQLKLDHRDYKSYPLNGYYVDFAIQKNGIGLISSDLKEHYTIRTVARKYFHLKNNFYYAAGLSAKASGANNPAYFLQQDMGYNNDFVRGYEYYVLHGYAWGIVKQNIKYAIIPTRVKKFSFIKTEKFNTMHYALYFNIFADAGYLKDTKFTATNRLHNSLLFGTGVGFDLVTYYDKVMRVEYAVNKIGEQGLFIHFVAPL